MMVLKTYVELKEPYFSDHWFELLGEEVKKVMAQVELVEALIRERMDEMRILD
jgi:hypothetical protein